MILLLGSDHTGKTTLSKALAQQFGMQVFKARRDTSYDIYMGAVAGRRTDPKKPFTYKPGPMLDDQWHYVCDRFFYCDLPYSEIFHEGQGSFSLKQFHNLHLATLAQNPVIVLTTKRAPNYKEEEQFSGDVPIPKSKLKQLLRSYKEYLDLLGLSYIEWDYSNPSMSVKDLWALSSQAQGQVAWWRELARNGVAGVGRTTAPIRVMVIAESIGPGNYHNLPFERGPSGRWMSELLDDAEIPLSSFYMTNWEKFPKDNTANTTALSLEVDSLRPRHYILLGSLARLNAKKVLLQLGVKESHIHELIHPGAIVNHSESIAEMEKRKKKFVTEWTAIWDFCLRRRGASTLTPTLLRAKGPDDITKLR